METDDLQMICPTCGGITFFGGAEAARSFTTVRRAYTRSVAAAQPDDVFFSPSARTAYVVALAAGLALLC